MSSTEVGFKPNESMAGNRRRVPGDVATSPAKGGVHGGNAIGGGLHFDEEIRFHEAGCGYGESGVGDSAGGWDNSATSALERFLGDGFVDNFELDVPNGFLAEWSITRALLEVLHDGVFDGAKQGIVRFEEQRVIDEDVWAGDVRF
ncbi:hypothetical protein pipiens_005632 [Culex pipiens pipiens]|uniref:Uncharacterized protein n=1 Tax=Culex pipiens pipiens TaxID=38569 RepID=A0ABD1DXD6_CULPP